MFSLHSPLSEVYREDGFAIFIGSAANAANPKALAEVGIKYILNVSDRIRFRRVDGPPILLYHVPLSDFGDTLLSAVLDDCFTTINEARENHGSILVHCQGGVNRSPTVVIAYLMSIGWSLRQAWDLVREKRTVASPHERYMEQLIEFEVELFGNATLDFAEYEQTSVQASLRKIRRQAIADATNLTTNPSTNPPTYPSTNLPTNPTFNPTINLSTNTITNATPANTTPTNTPSTNTQTTNNPDTSSPEKQNQEAWKYPFHTSPTHQLPQLNLKCIS